MLPHYPDHQLDLMSTMFDTAPFPGYFCAGEELMVTFANKAALEKWGRNKTMLGLTLAQVFSGSESQSFLDAAMQAYTNGIATYTDQPQYTGDLYGERKTCFFKNVFQPYHAQDGKVVGIICWQYDVTAKIKDEKDPQVLDFITIASHELKTPLTTVKSYVQLLLEKAQKENDNFRIKALTRAESQVNQMSTLIDNLLNNAAVADGKLTLTQQEFNVHELLLEILDDARLNFQTHNIIMNDCEDAFVYADRNKIAQVLGNLINNAVKYSPNGSDVNISCEVLENDLQISVADRGIGISLQDQQNLFKRFYRVQNEQTKNVSGFGIGLYLVAEILRYHNSSIQVDSDQGRGSTFYFTLPQHKK